MGPSLRIISTPLSISSPNFFYSLLLIFPSLLCSSPHFCSNFHLSPHPLFLILSSSSFPNSSRLLISFPHLSYSSQFSYSSNLFLSHLLSRSLSLAPSPTPNFSSHLFPSPLPRLFYFPRLSHSPHHSLRHQVMESLPMVICRYSTNSWICSVWPFLY